MEFLSCDLLQSREISTFVTSVISMKIQKTRRKRRLIRVNVNCDFALHFYCYYNNFSATTMEGGVLQMLHLIHEIKIKSDDLGSCLQTVYSLTHYYYLKV